MTNKKKMLCAFALLSYIFINIVPERTELVFRILSLPVVLGIFFKAKLYRTIGEDILSKNRIAEKVLSLFVSVFLGMLFVSYWIFSERLLHICFDSPRIRVIVVCLSALVFTVGSFILAFSEICFVKEFRKRGSLYKDPALGDGASLGKGTCLERGASLNKDANFKKEATLINDSGEISTKVSAREALIILLSAIVAVTLCSRSSPLYAFNTWVDANCFFTVGKSITKGLVMYRDIFEQKGPILYFIYAGAYLVSHTSFLGVYFVEIICGFIFLLFSYKIIKLVSGKVGILSVVFLAAVAYSSVAFSNGGSSEEICLPLLAISYCLGLKAIVSGSRISYKGWMLIGIMSGLVLWIKFSMLGFFIGLGVIFLFVYVKNKWFKELGLSFAMLLLGVFIASIPVIVYFASTGAFGDLFEVYFYDNLFRYSTSGAENRLFGLVINLSWGFISFTERHLLGIVMVHVGFIYLLRKHEGAFFYHFFMFVAAFFFTFSGGRFYPYYSYALTVFAPVGIALFAELGGKVVTWVKDRVGRSNQPEGEGQLEGIIENGGKKQSGKLAAVIGTTVFVVVCIAYTYFMSPNTYMMKYSKEDLPQYKFDEIISKSEHPTLINYGWLDCGFYTYSDITPTCKYFCGLNLPYDVVENEQMRYVNDAQCEYVATRFFKMSAYQLTKYEQVCKCTFEEEKDYVVTYYLYKRIKN